MQASASWGLLAPAMWQLCIPCVATAACPPMMRPTCRPLLLSCSSRSETLSRNLGAASRLQLSRIAWLRGVFIGTNFVGCTASPVAS